MSTESVLSDSAPLDLRFSAGELAATREHIVAFISGVVDDAEADGAVVGLSGGIDSTLTAFLAVEALGADAVHGLVMPSEVNTADNMSDAERVADHLGIACDVIDVDPLTDTFLDSYQAGADDQLAAGNVRVRIRGVLNYFVANAENRVVLGTGNRSEALTGYFTKYGDQAVDCNPIGTLYKQQVRQLAGEVGVPWDLVMKTPSAEMWLGQTDEAEMGISYDTLDAILAVHVDGGLSTSATVRLLDGVTAEQVAHVRDLVAASEHKRRMPPAPDPLDL